MAQPNQAQPNQARPTHEHVLRVRYGETDQMGVVHHANFLLYMEEGRTRLMRELGLPYSEMERQGWALVVRSTELRYRGSAHYDEELRIVTRIERLGRASAVFAYDIHRAADDRLLVQGSTDLACVRLDGDRRPTALPDEFVELLGGRTDEPR